MTLSDIIQLLAVLVALGASISALVIATKDRKTQLRIAREAQSHDRLGLELEYAVRLSANLNRGASTDTEEAKRMGSEALALANVVGQRWVPRMYARSMNYRTPDELRARLDDEDETRTPRWLKEKIESGLAVQAIVAEMYGSGGNTPATTATYIDASDAVDDGWNRAGA